MADWREAGHTAVITGGASGIGLAAARTFVGEGLNVVVVDRDEDALGAAKDALGEAAADGARVITKACDVSDREAVDALAAEVYAELGAVHVLMNNAGMVRRVGAPWEDVDVLRQVLEVNLYGVIHGCAAFIPRMLEGGAPGVVVNTGSKQGITKPPGNHAYNLSKAGVLTYTESVAHAFVKTDGCRLTAHLFVPGFVYTGMVKAFLKEKPAGAWTPEQTVDFFLERLEAGDFYILCPDNETPRALDDKRIQWTADDLIHNRPALSRWHPDHADAFAKYIAD